jgi:hypothetical protein
MVPEILVSSSQDLAVGRYSESVEAHYFLKFHSDMILFSLLRHAQLMLGSQ